MLAWLFRKDGAADRTERELRQLALAIGILGVLFVGGRKSIAARILGTRDVAAELDPGLRQFVMERAPRVAGGARLASLEVYGPRFWPVRVVRTYSVEARFAVADTLQCRSYVVKWRDPAHSGLLPEWSGSLRRGWVRDCAGRKLGRTRDWEGG